MSFDDVNARLRAALPGVVAVGAVALGVWVFVGPTVRWERQAPVDLTVRILDYTVPFENYREHAGILWMLRHLKARRPAARGGSTPTTWATSPPTATTPTASATSG